MRGNAVCYVLHMTFIVCQIQSFEPRLSEELFIFMQLRGSTPISVWQCDAKEGGYEYYDASIKSHAFL